MNNRIKELAEQIVGLSRLHGGEFALMGNNQVEKFAELIVEECIDVALEQKNWVEDMETLNPHDEFWNRARIQQSQHIIDKIREHFGVEE